MTWPPIYRQDVDEETTDEMHTETDDTLVDEALISLVLVVGAALFLFPEPGTSVLGVFLMGIGVFAWFIDALS